MKINRNNIGVELSPSVLRIANVMRRKGKLYLSAWDEAQLPYRDFDDLYRHPQACADVLNDLCKQHAIHGGRCMVALPVRRSKVKCIALPLMKRAALLRMMRSKHFWHRHLGVGNETHSYAWLRTVHDRKQYRLALYLMAVPTRDLAFYHALFARTRLSLQLMTLSSLVYYSVLRHDAARRLVALTEDDAYLAHFGQNAFSYHTLLSDTERIRLYKGFGDNATPHDKTESAAAGRRLFESLHEHLRSEKRDTQDVYWAGDLDTVAHQCNASLNNITLKALDVCTRLKVAAKSGNAPAAFSAAIALALCLAKDAETFKGKANLNYNHNTAYYKSAACWLVSAMASAILFFYYHHLSELNTAQHPQLQHRVLLSSQRDAYRKKIKATQQQSKRQQTLQTQMHFLSEQHQVAMDFWSRLGTLIPQSIKIEHIDCQWQSSCLIAAEARNYGQLILFAEQIKQLDIITDVVIGSTQAVQKQSDGATQFTLLCKLKKTMRD